MALDDILLEVEEKMAKTEEFLVKEFSGVRTGKASPGLVENVQVEAYGSMMRIRDLATITTPESRLILIQPQLHRVPLRHAARRAPAGEVEEDRHERRAGFACGRRCRCDRCRRGRTTDEDREQDREAAHPP